MIIRNGNIVTWTNPNQILEGHEILIRDGIIQVIRTCWETDCSSIRKKKF